MTHEQEPERCGGIRLKTSEVELAKRTGMLAILRDEFITGYECVTEIKVE